MSHVIHVLVKPYLLLTYKENTCVENIYEDNDVANILSFIETHTEVYPQAVILHKRQKAAARSSYVLPVYLKIIHVNIKIYLHIWSPNYLIPACLALLKSNSICSHGNAVPGLSVCQLYCRTVALTGSLPKN